MIGEMHMTSFVSSGEMHITDLVSSVEQVSGGDISGGDFFRPRVTEASIFCLVRSTDGGESNRDAVVHRDV